LSSIDRVLDDELEAVEAADIVDTEVVVVVVVVVVVDDDDVDDADAVVDDNDVATAGAVEVEVVDEVDNGSTRARVAFGRIFQATMEASS
jgi:hypothetical protein